MTRELTHFRSPLRRTETRALWGHTDLGKTVLDATRDRIADLYRKFDHVFVSFSGGKDSTAVFQVALEIATKLNKLPLRTVFYDEECISYETEAYARRVAERDDVDFEWLCLPVLHRNACSQEHPFWHPWDPSCTELWVRDMPIEAITEYPGFPSIDDVPSIPMANPLLAPASRGRCVILMGIRAQESIMRRNAVSNARGGNWTFKVTKNLWKAYPVYDWTTDDVWLAPERLQWDYNESYDVMEMAGVTRWQQRLAPPFGEEPIQALGIWAKCFPDIWDKMILRVPGAHTAAMYGRTELYSFRSRSEKPPGLTWEEYIFEKLKRHGDEVQDSIASKLRMMIRRHYARVPRSPILVRAPHPETGVSWHLLLAMAERGDMKDRRSGMSYLTGKAYENAKRNYAEELAEWHANGDQLT